MPDFKIAAAQVASVRGDVEGNVAVHAAALAAAAEHAVSVLVFPELSLTGYEPDLAAELAMTPDDARLAPLLALARQHRIGAIVGAPLRVGAAKPALGAIVITADGGVRAYHKMHLGSSETAYFTPGDTPLTVDVAGHKIGVAVCADASRPAHPQGYADLGADVYAAGVFLNAEWYATDAPRLAGYAVRHRMLVVMANHAASVGTYTSVGKSALWAADGALLAQAEGDGKRPLDRHEHRRGVARRGRESLSRPGAQGPASPSAKKKKGIVVARGRRFRMCGVGRARRDPPGLVAVTRPPLTEPTVARGPDRGGGRSVCRVRRAAPGGCGAGPPPRPRD